MAWKEEAEDAQKKKRAVGSEVKASAKNGCIVKSIGGVAVMP